MDDDKKNQVTHIGCIDPQTAASGSNQPPMPPVDATTDPNPDPPRDKVLERIKSMTCPSKVKVDSVLANTMIEAKIREKLENARTDLVTSALEIATDAAPMIIHAKKKDENNGDT